MIKLRDFIKILKFKQTAFYGSMNISAEIVVMRMLSAWSMFFHHSQVSHRNIVDADGVYSNRGKRKRENIWKKMLCIFK